MGEALWKKWGEEKKKKSVAVPRLTCGGSMKPHCSQTAANRNEEE